eukprot:7518274-Pyramimonas_sp.AAC.2
MQELWSTRLRRRDPWAQVPNILSNLRLPTPQDRSSASSRASRDPHNRFLLLLVMPQADGRELFIEDRVITIEQVPKTLR